MNLRYAIEHRPQPGAVPRVPEGGFAAVWQGQHVRVTAVLERTAVVFPPGARPGEAVLVKHQAVEVGEIEWVQADDSVRQASRRGRQNSVSRRRLPPRVGRGQAGVPTRG